MTPTPESKAMSVERRSLAIDMAGKKFNRLTVVDRAPIKNRQAYWNCVCDCGNKVVVLGQWIRSGHTKSCGCLRADFCRENHVTHGYARHNEPRSTEYVIWCGMLARCNNPKHRAYPGYGGRGIFVCDRWLVFENFLADMGRRPSARHSIDRVNNDGGYEPANCRWATWSQQARNRRKPKRTGVSS